MGATERVLQYIDYKGVTKYKFCKNLGFSNKCLDNSSNMGTDKAGKILRYYPDINPEWLLTGKGEMIKKNEIHNIGDEKDRYIIELQKEKIEELEKKIKQLKKDLESPYGYRTAAEKDS